MQQKELLSPAELAELLGLPLATIYVMNCQGTAPPRYKLGTRVRYRRSEVDAWIESRRVESATPAAQT